jgi:hypothetical protein
MKTRDYIINWIDESIQSGSWQQLADLHIDQIFLPLQVSDWVEKGIEALLIAQSWIDRNSYPFYVVLKIPLKFSERERHFKNSVISDVVNILDETPPSLYLFHKEKNIWKNARKKLQSIELENINLKGLQASYSQSFKDDGYWSFVYIEGIPGNDK